MGGRALKNTVTRRYLREEFDIISKELIDTLKLTFDRVDMPLFYGKKESFGDADILVVGNPDINMHEYLTKTFSPNEIFHNGSCWSFDYKELQVDVITSSAEHYDTSLMYFSYNDLGNYIGRLAHGFGLKYGQEGLWLEYQFKGSNVGSIPISKNYEKIFNFLGLSFERYLQGFETLEEIFEYIAKSKYFNWQAFQLSELNKINRDRNAKRASYMSFLKWIEENAMTSDYAYEVFKDKTIYYNEIDNFFPEANVRVLSKEITMTEIDYTDQSMRATRFYDRVITSAYTPYGIKCMDSDFIARIMNINNPVENIFEIARRHPIKINVHNGKEYESMYYETYYDKLELKNQQRAYCHGLRVVWRQSRGNVYTRDFFYEVIPRFSVRTRKESKFRIACDIRNNHHLHQDIKDNLLYNLDNYAKLT